ncbi:unnamed protein product [Ectocarpus sp. 12 AP-2014]
MARTRRASAARRGYSNCVLRHQSRGLGKTVVVSISPDAVLVRSNVETRIPGAVLKAATSRSTMVAYCWRLSSMETPATPLACASPAWAAAAASNAIMRGRFGSPWGGGETGGDWSGSAVELSARSRRKLPCVQASQC